MYNSSYTIKDVARLCRASEETVQVWVQREGLAVIAAGPEDRIAEEALSGFLKTHGIWRAPDGQTAGARVLVADDEADVRGMVCRVTRRCVPDVRLEEVADGFMARERIAAFAPDVVILDVGLPGMDGLGLCRRLRLQPPETGKPRIIVISGSQDAALREAAMREGADDFLFKPFYPRDLEKILAACLPQR